MSRFLPPSNVQADSHSLRNDICRLTTPQQMAEVSSHLRNFAVAEVIGFIAMLDGHPKVIGQPSIVTNRARDQQARGSKGNPFTHAIPSDMLLNGDRLINLYQTTEARTELRRVFGMGVMAPGDWEDQAKFPFQPGQNNVVDAIAERHRYGDGLVEAFKECGEATVHRGVWDGSGIRKHSLSSLTKCIGDIYESVWIPRARVAYNSARIHFATQIDLARSSSDTRRISILKLRLDILDAQIRTFERDTNIAPEAAKNVWKFASPETWN